MAKISLYPGAGTPADADFTVIVQGGVTKKITYSQIKAGIIGDVDALIYKGVIDCSGNPNYPAASAGHVYKISVAGRLGGASGPVVSVGDIAICSVDATVTGTHAAVGANWNIIQANVDLESATAQSDMLFGGPSPFGWVRKTLVQAKVILGIGGSIPSPTAANDVIMGSGSPLDWVKKTIAELKTALGLGSAAYTASTDYSASNHGHASLHTQGTDQGLDTGGSNAVTAAQVKGAVTNSHASGSDNQDLSGKVSHSLTTAEDDVLVGGPTPFGTWMKKTLAEFKAIIMPAPGPIGGATPNTAAFTTLKLTTGSGQGKIPVSDADGDLSYLTLFDGINLIGNPGKSGFGVGICPEANLPAGMTPRNGCYQLGHENYGNYIFTDGSIMVYVPKFYYRIGHASNPTYAVHGVNSVSIKGVDTYATTGAANADGYVLHRAFTDGGVEKVGFFFDKYKCSKVANGAGFTAGSIKNGLPISSAAAHNPFADLTGGANYYYSALDLAHRRDGVDGAVNVASIFHCRSQFQGSAIALLAMSHGQNSTSTVNCAWYHATYNYPKGCNNNALKDTDDTTVIWQSDGYSNCGKTGSAGYGGGAGNVFAKSTHNGQDCGIADINGLMYEISIGVTCIATTKAIEAMSRAAACEITITAHGLIDGDILRIGTAVTQADWTGLNGKVWPITKTGDNTFTVAFNSSGFATAYDAGDPGTGVLGKFYVAKSTVAMKTFTNGVAAATDHWGATGVAAMMEAFIVPFGAGDAFAQRFGSGANQVLSEAASGNAYQLTSLGVPKDANGMDGTGTDLFGKDYCYVYVIDLMCLLACSSWTNATNAGAWSVRWHNTREVSSDYVGFRAACYPV